MAKPQSLLAYPVDTGSMLSSTVPQGLLLGLLRLNLLHVASKAEISYVEPIRQLQWVSVGMLFRTHL
jgi:hypothetical protein